MASQRSFRFPWKKKGKEILENKIQPVENDEFSDLASKMIEKELELENKCEPSVIQELISIYSQVIEFYSRKNDTKYMDFQDRMQKMLKKPQVLRALNYENKKKESPIMDTEPLPVLAEVISPESDKKVPEVPEVLPVAKVRPMAIQITDQHHGHRRHMRPPTTPPPHHLEMSPTSPKSPEFSMAKSSMNPPNMRNMKILVDRHKENSKTTSLRAAADFKSQESALERRLASRKKIQLTRSMSFTTYSPTDTSGIFEDLDEEDQNNEKFECFVVDELAEEACEKYEKMLEEIMEKNFGERALKVAEIKCKYETQISEMSGMGDIMKMVVQQMKTNMQEEIEKTLEEFDAKRKEQIAKLKEHN